LTHRLDLSARQIERLFARQVGLPPKGLARIVRFQRVLAAIDRGVPRDWAAAALEAGYYDQAHLARDFREIAGETPLAYARRRHGISDFFLLRE
jgi:methylphosphotriester-DNA--protein-cysteine methyltransferase